MMFRDSFFIDKLAVQVHNSREEMGAIAALGVANRIKNILNVKEEGNIIFAAAPSQNEFISSLLTIPDVEWNRINAFHMDEYIGIDPEAPQSFGKFLKTKLFDLIPFKEVHYINPLNPQHECSRYAQLLEKYPTDIVCLGIGENGHLAFNDPPIADFNDPKSVKIVELDEVCRNQQVNDGCFDSLADVPKTAITLTIPALMSSQHMSCVVPGPTKADAVSNTLYGDVTTYCPASILRTHQDAVLFLDSDSYSSATD